MSNPHGYLDQIENVGDLKKLSVEALPHLADEIREFILQKVSNTGAPLRMLLRLPRNLEDYLLQ